MEDMTGKRAYGDGCTVAHALDLVGERWALLIVRDLLLGPKRYSSLEAGLPGASTNALSQRLRELEQFGVINRRKLGPPANSWVYELTEWGRKLEPALMQLSRWGLSSPYREPDGDSHVSIDSLVLALRTHVEMGGGPREAEAVGDTFLLHVDEETFAVHVDEDGLLDVSRGEPRQPDATITMGFDTFKRMVTLELSSQDAVAGGLVTVSGDQEAVRRFFRATVDDMAAGFTRTSPAAP